MSGGSAPGRIKRRKQRNGHRGQRNTDHLQRLDSHRQRRTIKQRADDRHYVIQLAGKQRAQHGTEQLLPTIEAELSEVRAEHTALRVSYDVRGSDLAHHQATIAQLRADARVAERIEAELKGAREELRTVMRDRDMLLRNPPALLTRMEAMEKVLQQILESTAQRGG